MVSKSELQTILKGKYGINKNISQSLSSGDCEQLLTLLNGEPSAAKLIDSLIDKNTELGNKNRHYGQLRNRSEEKLKQLQIEHQALEKSIKEIERSNGALGDRKRDLSQEHAALETEIKTLTSRNRGLSLKVQTLTTQNDELVEANDRLKKDNKDLKNVVDQIRLRLARDTKMLLQYEDSEIRKALIRLFRWTLG